MQNKASYIKKLITIQLYKKNLCINANKTIVLNLNYYYNQV
jgi:hypothetical protein